MCKFTESDVCFMKVAYKVPVQLLTKSSKYVCMGINIAMALLAIFSGCSIFS